VTRQEFTTVLEEQYQLHQALAPRDVYKLIYQAVFGPEHSLGNTHAALERLYHEVLQLPATPTSLPLLEPLSPLLCRVNLQPFIHRGGDPRMLWRQVRQTVRTYQPGTLTDLQCLWKMFLATAWAQRYDVAELEHFWQYMATHNFGPVHHSPSYAAANAPHYRVILRALVSTP